MKIAVIAPTHIPARRANTIQVMKMCQAFCNLGHEVRLIVPGTPEAEEREWESIAAWYGLQTRFPIEWLPAPQSLRRYDYGLGAVRKARRWHADLIYTRLPQAAAIGSQSGVSTIFELHDLPYGNIGPWIFRRFLEGRCAARLVVITHALQAALEGRFPIAESNIPVLVAPDGVDLQRYEGLPEPGEARRWLAERSGGQLSLPLDDFVAGYTGHLYAGRGADLLLELATRLPEIRFLLAGGEPDDIARLDAAARGRRLENFHLAGFVPNAELPRYQAACDALLMPYQEKVAASSGGDISRFLSPMKLFEYLASRRTILSSNLPVLQEVLNAENAILLPPADVQSWTAALRRLQSDSQLRDRLAAAARDAATQYTWERRAALVLQD